MNALIKLIIAVTAIFLVGNSYAAESINHNKELVKKAIIYTIEDRSPNIDYNKYISKDYVQYVDGKTFNYTQFVEHIQLLKNDLKSMKVFFEDMIAEGDKVVSVHLIKAIKKDNSEMIAKVIALITVKNDKIISCNELTHMIKGQDEDRDMGSRQ